MAASLVSSKAYFGVNEILTTVMLNSIAVQLMNFLLRGPMIDPDQFGRASRIPQTARLSAAFDLRALYRRGCTRARSSPSRSPSSSTSSCGARRSATASVRSA